VGLKTRIFTIAKKIQNFVTNIKQNPPNFLGGFFVCETAQTSDNSSPESRPKKRLRIGQRLITLASIE
jgi:hypothetical protein